MSELPPESVPENGAPASESSAPKEALVPLKILFVDDEPDLAPLIRQKFRRNVRRGELILEFAEEHDASLIVIGSHRPGRLERLVLGSVSEAVLHKAQIPVLIVPRSKE